MAYDELMAERIRALVQAQEGVTEKNMFGGLAFLVHGNMAVAASGQGGLLVRVDPEQTDELLASTKAQVMIMRGRNMPGWLRVAAKDVTNDDELAEWVKRGTGYARSLPAK
jgi:TfoX/Sxy family transcriptional regulator of competence genes